MHRELLTMRAEFNAIYSACFQALTLLAVAGGLFLLGAGCRFESGPVADKPKPEVTFKPQEMADSVRAVIAADREIYARLIFDKYPAQLADPPLPGHLLRSASQAVQQKGAEFHYVARSLWPINPGNKPETATETEGLRYVAEHPDSNYYAEEFLGGRRYFTAVYPDVALVPSCVECHNQRPDSPKNDFKLGDVMGGIVVRVPLEF